MSWKKFYAYTHREGYAIPHYLRAAYHTLTHWVTQLLINVIGVVGIALLGSNQNTHGWLIAACIVYTLLEAGTIVCNEYNKYAQRLQAQNQAHTHSEIKVRDSLIESTCSLYGTASAGLYRNTRSILNSGWAVSLATLREAFGFQSMAMQICHDLYTVLRNHFDIRNHTVTVYQRFDKTATNSVCKMIAYGNEYQRESLSYSREYSIPVTCNDKTPYHSRIFSENSDTIRLLVNRNEVEKYFRNHKNCEDRENSIQQYIGIPMKACGEHITFILQVDCDRENCFGNTEDAMLAFTKSVVYPYASLLAMCYEIDRMLEVSSVAGKSA